MASIRIIPALAITVLAVALLASCGRVEPSPAIVLAPQDQSQARRVEPKQEPQRLIAELPPTQAEKLAAALAAKPSELRQRAAREWTSADGKFRTRAEFAALIDDAVRLKKESGAFVSVPLASLALADRQHVKELIRTDPAANVIFGKVVAVTDGDTITILDEDNKQHRIRLEGIDAPEAGQEFGSVAKRVLSEKVFDKFPRTEWRETDKYGRTLGHVYLDSRHINLELVAEGYAWHFKEYSSDPQLAHGETVARQQRLGLWADSSPVAPWEFRHPPAPAKVAAQPRAPPVRRQSAMQPQAAPQIQDVTVYITKTGAKYHSAGCRHLAKSAIPISLGDAQRRYSACSVCNPP